MLKSLVLRCWLLLFWIDMLLHLQEYAGMRRCLMKRKSSRGTARYNPALLSEALDFASIFYLRNVSPLHRALCRTVLLRDYGWAAEFVVGLQLLPLESYAWVEVEGTPIHEKAGALDTYQVIDRC